MSRFPNIRKSLEIAFASGNDEKIEDALLYVINGIVEQCPNEDRSYDASDIDDLAMQPKYKNGSMPRNFVEAYEMLSLGDLILPGSWRVCVSHSTAKQKETLYVLYHQGNVVDSHKVFATLVDNQKLDAQLRGWMLQSHS